jgi:hypothetical protein
MVSLVKLFNHVTALNRIMHPTYSINVEEAPLTVTDYCMTASVYLDIGREAL